MRKFLSLTVFSTICFSYNNVSFAQTEYLVTIDPTTGIHTIIDSIPEVKWITLIPQYCAFDDEENIYTFRGADANYNWDLVRFDVDDSVVISTPPFPIVSDPNDNVLEIAYDSNTEKYYGLHWDASAAMEYFVEIDPLTGLHSIINSIPNVQMIGVFKSTIDETNGIYSFYGFDGSDERLYSLELSTGNIISNPIIPDYGGFGHVHFYEYDNQTGLLYALYTSSAGTPGTEEVHLVTVNPINHNLNFIGLISGAKLISVSHVTFDEFNNRFVFQANDALGISRLYSVDATDASIVSNPIFPNLIHPDDNILEIIADDDEGIIYALHWKVNPLLPNANFNMASFYVCAENPFQFIDNSTNNPTSWLWDFGDGTFSTDQNPSHIYSNLFAFAMMNVTLTVSNAYGSDSYSYSIFIDPAPNVNASPNATICAGETIQILATGSSNYTWDNGLGAGATHMVSPDTTTTFIVTTSNGFCSATDSVKITVNYPNEAGNPNPTFICEADTIIDLNTTISGFDSGGTWVDNNNTGYLIGNECDFSALPNDSIYYFTYFFGAVGACPADEVVTSINFLAQPNAGIASIGNLTCSNDSQIFLNDLLSNEQMGGIWLDDSLTGAITGNYLNPLMLQDNLYSFTYVVTNSCGQDDETIFIENFLAPTVSIVGKTEMCIGDVLQIQATGALDYAWNNGLGTNPIQIVSPVTTTTYVATGFDNNCSNSDSITITVLDCLGFDENDNNNFTVYPNPFIENFTLISQNSLSGKLKIYMISGQVIFESEISGNEIIVDSKLWESGIYIIQYSDEINFQTITYRIVKQ